MILKIQPKLIYLISLFIILLNISCRHNPIGIANQPIVCFTSEVLPIIQSNCAKSGCHNGRGETRLDLSTASGIRKNVTPFQPFNSKLYTATVDTWGNIMPPSPSQPLPKDLRTIIYVWILQGADTTCTGN